MEEPIGKLCGTVAKFCNHLETSCSSLSESAGRRPIPLDSASTTFVASVNRRVSAAAGDLNMLESMTFATVSFEELLGHCGAVLKKNQSDIVALEDHLRSSFNYIPPIDFEEGDGFDSNELEDPSSAKSDNFAEQDELLDDSLSLKKFGISDVSLASIASQTGPEFDIEEPDLQIGDVASDFKQYDDDGVGGCCLSVSSDDYESLPKHMKGLVSWDDLLVAVEKMNAYMKTKREKADTFHQDDIEKLDLGNKARSYLLVLIKMKNLCIETNEGVISYRVL